MAVNLLSGMIVAFEQGRTTVLSMLTASGLTNYRSVGVLSFPLDYVDVLLAASSLSSGDAHRSA